MGGGGGGRATRGRFIQQQISSRRMREVAKGGNTDLSFSQLDARVWYVIGLSTRYNTLV